MSARASELDALVATARAAIDGTEPEGVVVFRGKSTVDAFGEIVRPFRPVLVAVLMWSLVYLRASMGAPILDPYGLVLRVVALGATLRAFLAVRAIAQQLPARLGAEKNALVLSPGGVVVRARGRHEAFARGDVIGFAPGDADGPPAILLAPGRAGRAWLVLPPGLEDPHGRIAEALESYVGDRPEGAPPPLPPADRRASDVYDRAAAGETEPGTTSVPRGRGWLLHGPYGALLVAVALAERVARLPQGASVGPLGYAVLALSIALPILWLVRGARAARAARGVAAVLTPEELLVRSPAGMARMPWQKVASIDVATRTLWSTLGGYQRLRTLTLRRANGGDVELREEHLGAPVRVVIAMIDVYAMGAVKTGT